MNTNIRNALICIAGIAMAGVLTYTYFLSPSVDDNFATAWSYQEQNRFKEAEDYYTRCLKQVKSPGKRAVILNNLGEVQLNLSNCAQAEASFTEALQIYRELAAKNPQACLPYVTAILRNLGRFYDLYDMTGNDAQAEVFHSEALQIRRKLAANNPQAYLPDVVQTLYDLGGFHERRFNYAQAKAFFTEALQIGRDLAANNPQAYLPHVATALLHLSKLSYDKALSLQYAKEAIEVLELCNDTPWEQGLREEARWIIAYWEEENQSPASVEN